MSNRSFPEAHIEELHRRYRDPRLSYGRLIELLNTCVLNEGSARGPSVALYHDLVVALLLLERLERGWTYGEPGALSHNVASPLEAAARDLLSYVQNKHEPMSHPDNLKLINEGDTILVNESRLWMLQLALPRRAKSEPSTGHE